MAYIPDEAVMRSGEIPPAAFRIYCYYCKCRDKETGLCFPSLSRIAADLGLKYTYASEMRKLLDLKDWIEIQGHIIRPLMGFDNLRIFPKKSSGISEDSREEESSTKSEDSFGKSRTNLREIPKQSSENSELPYIEPAHSTSPDNQPNEPAQSEGGKKGGAKRKQPTAARAEDVQLPEWLPPPLWAKWCRYKRERKDKFTAMTAEGQVVRLGKLREEGYDPADVIQQSIDQGWQGLFEISERSRNGYERRGKGGRADGAGSRQSGEGQADGRAQFKTKQHVR